MTGKPTIAETALLLLLLATVLVPAATAQGDTVTRGGTFTVTVAGIPRTAYDLWPKGTSEMTGEPGDQPPVIIAGQVDVVQDPPGGPYTIGLHPTSGGGTIRDDVPPDSSTTPATSYYAEVTTDIQGYGTVIFRTSAATAAGQQFHIVAQNPADLGEEVKIFFGGVPTPAPTPVTPLPTTLETPPPRPPTTPVPVTTPVPATTVQTTTTLITPPAEATSRAGPGGEMTPVRGMPLPAGIALAATGIGLLLASGRRGTG